MTLTYTLTVRALAFFLMNSEYTKRNRPAAMHRRDSDDIAAGRRTPSEVKRDNAWMPNPRDWEIGNFSQATCALRKRR